MATSKYALVTGGNKGLGLETVKQLAQKGIYVFLGARNVARGEDAIASLKSEGIENVSLLQVDMEDTATFKKAYEAIEKEAGQLDILVNNAGVQLENNGWSANTTTETSLTTLRKTFDINFFGLVELTNILLPLLKKSEAGRIVNLSSVLGSLSLHADAESSVYDTKVFAYNTSKAAVNMYTIHLAHALKDTNIQVNSAHPGWVKTDMGTDTAPMGVSEGAETSVKLATTEERDLDGRYMHLNDELPW